MAQARILLIFAHPDDESFAAAGLARRYADEGASIALVTATRGDAGRAGNPPLCSRDELPARREAELRTAASILGIPHLHLLDYRDRELGSAPPDGIRSELVRLVRLYRPHVAITFDPNGVNGHPDHVAIARFATDALVAAADPRWYPAGADAYRVPRLLWTSPVLPWEVTRVPDLAGEPGIDFILDVERCRNAKAGALRAHRTQHVSIDRCFFSKPDVDRILAVEVFRQAWGPSVPEPAGDDVLLGIDVA